MQNFRITDEHLGEGGPKAKFQANVNAIRLLKELEAAGQQAKPRTAGGSFPICGLGRSC